MKQWFISIVMIMALLAIAAFGYPYITDQQAYISTDNASLQADMYSLSATQSGVLTDWKIKEGDLIKVGGIVGKITNSSLTSEVDATVVKTSVYAKQNVLQGQTLAQMADLNKTYVLAYIDEDQIRNVKTGKKVKVNIESLSDESYEGTVKEIGLGTGNSFQTNPSLTNNNAEKEIQRIPVKITVSDLPINRLTLGVHAEVKIEK
ncbi:HlyD family secretion protein [Shimazuella kribbensis]|uniref:HlyD family secretion protein n=1 Tax=Shimazuella kribbensis TaxID=139808 RepID=UPI00041E9B53|nr:HlyD family efflux transporter periplasmic adaptor subunit [Shimazuella kribbensis]